MEGRIFRPLNRGLRPVKLRPSRTPREAQYFSIYASSRRLEQANPLGGYYESLLSQPLPTLASATRQPTSTSPAEQPAKTNRDDVLAKARVVFGSRLAGPAERRSEIVKQSTMIAGILVPPRPEEPDNCCMSGCVNCVWDRYGDELQEWATARKAADANLRKEKAYEKSRSRRKAGTAQTVEVEESSALSMDDDGGRSESNWGTGLETDLFKGVPIGILEFMKQEKRLREKHAREGTRGG